MADHTSPAEAPKIHPRAVTGRFRRIKTALTMALLGLCAIIPWIRWDRGAQMPDQAILFSFPNMRAYVFDTVIWAQHYYFLTALLIVAALGLFLATALFGRVWCGFTCPQTVWTDLFMGIERMVEGDRNQRIRLDRQGWTLGKVLKKAVKHALWMMVSMLTGGVFVFYFTDAVTGSRALLTGEASPVLYGFWSMFTGFTYVMAGWAREQFCTYMCPWPRIQGGMLDEESLVVSYDAGRGEPRASARLGQSFQGRGQCVDCNLCVQVCPTGIDIRHGMQMECIGCALCADACDSVMRRFGLPVRLVGWRTPSLAGNLRFLRPRTLTYGGLIVATLALTGLGLAERPTLDLAVLPDRSPASVRLSDGSVRNGYTLRVINREQHALGGVLHLSGLPDATMTVVGEGKDSVAPTLSARPDTVETYRIFVRQNSAAVRPGTTAVKFSFGDRDHPDQASAASAFIAGDGQ